MHEMRGPVLLSGEHLPKADVLWRNLDATVLPDELERRLSMASGGDLGDDRADGRANEGSRSSSTGARQMIAESISKLVPASRTTTWRRWCCTLPRRTRNSPWNPLGAGRARAPTASGAWRSTGSSNRAPASGSSRATTRSRRPDRSTRRARPVSGIDPPARRSCREP
jgi:hypothetical protein